MERPHLRASSLARQASAEPSSRLMVGVELMDVYAGGRPMDNDVELKAMQTIRDALEQHDAEVQQRILRWVTDRYLPKRQPGARAGRPRKAAAA